MGKKKLLVVGSIILVFLALGAVAFFGFKKYGAVKKITATPSIADISKSDNQPAADQPSDEQQSSQSSDTPATPVNNNDANAPTADTPSANKSTQTSSTDVPKPAAGIVNKLVSWGFEKSSSRTIKAVIIHTSYNAIGGNVFDFDKVIQEWKDAGVSPHYAIDRNGTIYQLVSDQNIAWHAGVAKLPDGTTDVNGASIGIEVVNDQDSKFTDAQYSALNSLISTLKKKYPTKYVLGHADIAPGRKTDPWGIEWGKVQK